MSTLPTTTCPDIDTSKPDLLCQNESQSLTNSHPHTNHTPNIKLSTLSPHLLHNGGDLVNATKNEQFSILLSQTKLLQLDNELCNLSTTSLHPFGPSSAGPQLGDVTKQPFGPISLPRPISLNENAPVGSNPECQEQHITPQTTPTDQQASEKKPLLSHDLVGSSMDKQHDPTAQSLSIWKNMLHTPDLLDHELVPQDQVPLLPPAPSQSMSSRGHLHTPHIQPLCKSLVHETCPSPANQKPMQHQLPPCTGVGRESDSISSQSPTHFCPSSPTSASLSSSAAHHPIETSKVCCKSRSYAHSHGGGHHSQSSQPHHPVFLSSAIASPHSRDSIRDSIGFHANHCVICCPLAAQVIAGSASLSDCIGGKVGQQITLGREHKQQHESTMCSTPIQLEHPICANPEAEGCENTPIYTSPDSNHEDKLHSASTISQEQQQHQQPHSLLPKKLTMTTGGVHYCPRFRRDMPRNEWIRQKPCANRFSLDEISLHSTSEDCWLIVNGKVYDITSMLSQHPGGVATIVKYSGQDATRHFLFHSKNAQLVWNSYLIGVVDTSVPATECCHNEQHNHHNNHHHNNQIDNNTNNNTNSNSNSNQHSEFHDRFNHHHRHPREHHHRYYNKHHHSQQHTEPNSHSVAQEVCPKPHQRHSRSSPHQHHRHSRFGGDRHFHESSNSTPQVPAHDSTCGSKCHSSATSHQTVNIQQSAPQSQPSPPPPPQQQQQHASPTCFEQTLTPFQLQQRQIALEQKRIGRYNSNDNAFDLPTACKETPQLCTIM